MCQGGFGEYFVIFLKIVFLHLQIFVKLLEMHIDMDSLEEAFGLYTEALEAAGEQK